mgnify:CR=1 FL=1
MNNGSYLYDEPLWLNYLILTYQYKDMKEFYGNHRNNGKCIGIMKFLYLH